MNNNVPIIGNRRVLLGAPGREIGVDIEKGAGAPELITQATQIAQRSVTAQGRADMAAQCNAFTLEPAALAVLVAAGDAVAAANARIDELETELSRLREIVEPTDNIVA